MLTWILTIISRITGRDKTDTKTNLPDSEIDDKKPGLDPDNAPNFFSEESASAGPTVSTTQTLTPPPRRQPVTSPLLEDPEFDAPLRKPVIYIFSPSDIDVSITLTLPLTFHFSALYPTPAIKHTPSGAEQINWTVRTRKDGTLVDRDTGLEISYLFWEAHAKKDALLSPPHSPTLPQIETFDPLFPSLNDTNSVLLPTALITPYLDQALKALGLHTEARTSFITFWLPFLLKHQYVALRFVPQSAYERSASLAIEPHPDVLTRVFMLFKGVKPDDVRSDWSTSTTRASEQVTFWRDVVGVNPNKAQDPSAYRVLEWGGMEVVS